jgi:hypothetical protein
VKRTPYYVQQSLTWDADCRLPCQEISRFHGNRSSITVFTRTNPEPHKSTHISLWSNITLFSYKDKTWASHLNLYFAKFLLVSTFSGCIPRMDASTQTRRHRFLPVMLRFSMLPLVTCQHLTLSLISLGLCSYPESGIAVHTSSRDKHWTGQTCGEGSYSQCIRQELQASVGLTSLRVLSP